MELSIKIEGPTHLLDGTDKFTKVLDDVLKKASEQIREYILSELDRSMMLASYMDQAPDPEVTRTIIRSIHVTPDRPPYTNIVIEYGDEYAHLYGGQFDEGVKDIITGLVDKAVQIWAVSQSANQLFTDLVAKELQ